MINNNHIKRYAIIGFGCAGYHAAKAIRENDMEGLIDVYSDHQYPPYNPMLTTYYASGKLDLQKMAIFGATADIEQRLHLTVHENKRVEKVHAIEKKLTFTDGNSKTFDKILVATGATAFTPPLPNLPKDKLFYMRTLEDAIKLKRVLEQRQIKSALVIGASMVGIKVAELLNKMRIKTTLADLSNFIFPLAAYEDIAHIIEKRVEQKGIVLKFGCGLTAIDELDNKLISSFNDSDQEESDIIVLCIGTRANIQIVDPNEIKVNKAIVVDHTMETSVSGIYSAGDCCEGNNLQSGTTQVIGLWANAGYQGATAGANMAGGICSYEGNILHNITHFMDMDFIGFGDNRLQGEEKYFGSPDHGMYIKAVLKDGKLAGVNILNNYRISGIVKNYILKQIKGDCHEITEVQRGILMKEGLTEQFIATLERCENECRRTD